MRSFISRFCLILLTATALSGEARAVALSSRPADTQAQQWIAASLKAMGGEASLRALHSLRMEGVGYRNLLEQSERPEGPWIPSILQLRYLIDLQNQRVLQHTQDLSFAYSETVVVVDSVAQWGFNDRPGVGNQGHIEAAAVRIALGPERVLLTAQAALDLRSEPDIVLQDIPHHVVTFTWHSLPVRLFLNAHTALPTVVEYVQAYPYDVFWNVWGDVRTRIYYSFWSLKSGGVHYPMQWDVVRNGQPDQTLFFTTLDVNPTLSADSFAISADIRTAFAEQEDRTIDDVELGSPRRPEEELAPGFVHIPGRWDVALVQQEDGLVVIEAPLSAGYTARVLWEAARRFPDLPVKAVISTSDAWPHFAGVRMYVARGIPVYALDVNIPQLTRFIHAPHRLHPDTLAHHPRTPDLHVVSGKTTIGTGPNRLELYPVRSETGERMMMVYAPAHRLLYGSDLVQPRRNGPPQYVFELVQAVEREGLSVETVFAMHADAMPWNEIQTIISKTVALPEE